MNSYKPNDNPSTLPNPGDKVQLRHRPKWIGIVTELKQICPEDYNFSIVRVMVVLDKSLNKQRKMFVREIWAANLNIIGIKEEGSHWTDEVAKLQE